MHLQYKTKTSIISNNIMNRLCNKLTWKCKITCNCWNILRFRNDLIFMKLADMVTFPTNISSTGGEKMQINANLKQLKEKMFVLFYKIISKRSFHKFLLNYTNFVTSNISHINMTELVVPKSPYVWRKLGGLVSNEAVDRNKHF